MALVWNCWVCVENLSIALLRHTYGVVGPMFTPHPLIKHHPKLIYDEEGLPGDTFIWDTVDPVRGIDFLILS